ncbi:MAG: hypothetical protein IPK82_21625 [Polyangiaceae bacterium]|nr:hypothetical protein [Polyangiaceae bacterium]
MAFLRWTTVTIMPDNISRGMLETFLLFLRPTDNQALLDFSSRVVEEAKNLGAPFAEHHRDKAQIPAPFAATR